MRIIAILNVIVANLTYILLMCSTQSHTQLVHLYPQTTSKFSLVDISLARNVTDKCDEFDLNSFYVLFHKLNARIYEAKRENGLSIKLAKKKKKHCQTRLPSIMFA